MALREHAGCGADEPIDSRTDVGGGTGVPLAGCQPQRTIGRGAQIADRQRWQTIGDRRPRTAVVGRAEDAAIRAACEQRRADNGKPGDTTRNQTRAAARIGEFRIAITGIVRVVGAIGDLRPGTGSNRQ
jgi:hypothetical protein